MPSVRIDEVADIRMGYPFRAAVKHESPGDVAVIQMKDFDEADSLQVENALRIALPTGKGQHFLRAGDLLFRSRGRSNGAALVSAGIGPAVLSAPMLLIRPHDIWPAYLWWYINAPATQARLAALAEGTSVQMISTETLKTLDVPLPQMRVQHRIAQIAADAAQEQALLAQVAKLRRLQTDHLLMTIAQEATP